ncbi:MAG: endolytic transglycosylase MltG [Bacteroidales bacterium]|nr:endolytic transglycosylase MltG [Bacteroidales bacterium]
MKNTIIAILGTITAAAAIFCYNIYVRDYQANTIENDAVIYIYRHTDYEGLIDSVKNAGILKNEKSFERSAKHAGLDTIFKPGRYVIASGLNNKGLVRTFARGWQTPVKLVMQGYIRNSEKMASFLSKKLEADSLDFIRAMQDTALMHELGFKKETYLSIFIPNTYEVYWTVTPNEFLQRMKKEYDNFWNESRLAKAKEIGLTQDEVHTLASIVIEETKYQPEMATVAGVYINRLKIGMKLQADPTVKFALNAEGITRVLNKHLEVDSPYNTYKYEGLPPGPITIAPIQAIDAVLNYKRHNYLYFCAKETFDGQHRFASSYAEHLLNARAYQRALSTIERSKPLSD